MASDKVRVLDLRPSRHLLNPHFESYKLSLDTFPSTEVKFDFEVSESYKPESCLSFHHAKIRSDFNALVMNNINDGDSTIAALFNANAELVLIDTEHMFSHHIVWKVPAEDVKQGHLFSACFIREDMLLVENGADRVYLLEIKRSPEFSAALLWSGTLGDGQSSQTVLLDNAHVTESGEVDFFSLAAESCNDLPQWVRSKLSSAMKPKAEESGYATSVYWHRLTKAEDNSSWTVSCIGRFVSSATCSLAVRNDVPDGGIILGGERPFLNMMLPEETESTHKDSHGEGRLYSWHQEKESVVVSFPLLHGNTTKEDVCVEIKPDSLAVKVAGEENGFELTGNLGGDVNVEASTWIIDDSPEFVKDPYANHRCAKKLEITLAKTEHGSTWINCIAGDERGHMVLTDDQLELVRDLAAPGEKHARPTLYDDDEVEDVSAKICRNGDDAENEAVIQWFDDSGKLSEVVYVGSPQAFLFSRSHPSVDICVKNDVDGCVWRPKLTKDVKNASQRSFEHIATFDALAYVLASKENRRFASCSPDLKLAAAADCRHHVYVYRSPEPSTLVNRKAAGHQTVSRQHVIAIDPPDESIIGFQLTNSAIFVLTPYRLVKFALASV